MSEEKYNIDEYPIEEELEEVMKLNKEQVKIIEDLQQKVEQLEKQLQTTANNCKQLENIRKEAIEYIKKNYYEVVYKTKGTMENDLLNILNKGDKNE